MKTITEIKQLFAMKTKAYNLGDLVPVVIAFGLIAIIGAVVLLILGDFQANASNTCFGANVIGTNVPGLCSGGATYYSPAGNGLVYGTSGINQIMSFLPLIALVVVAAVIIGTVVGAFVLGGGAAKEF